MNTLPVSGISAKALKEWVAQFEDTDIVAHGIIGGEHMLLAATNKGEIL